MKVLMIGNDPSVKGGITSVISQLMEHDWYNDGIEMEFIPTYIEASSTKKILFFAKAYQKIKRTFKCSRPDVVHIHMSYKGSFTRKYEIHKLCLKNGIPDIIHLHGSEFQKWYDASGSKQKAKIRQLLRECSIIIVLGSEWNKIIKEIEPSANTLVVSNMVPIREKNVLWKIPFKVLFMGVFIKRKGIADLFYAVRLLKEQNKLSDIQFVIAGSGTEESNLKALAKELKIEYHVSFIGWTEGDEKERVYSECQILVLPSYNEGLPMTILEAMSYGMPILATNVGDISSAVHAGENGYLFEPGDIQSLADGIYKMASQKEVFEKMNRKSKVIVASNFSDVNYYTLILNAYRSVQSQQ